MQAVIATVFIASFLHPATSLETTVTRLTILAEDEVGEEMVNSPNPANLLGSILSAEKDLAFIGAAVGDGGVTSSGVISQLASWENISSTCLQDVSTYLQDLLTLKAYALKSKSKLQSNFKNQKLCNMSKQSREIWLHPSFLVFSCFCLFCFCLFDNVT